MRSIFNLGFGLIIATAALTQIGCASTGGGGGRDVAASHADVTPFNKLASQLTMKSGQTYLGFMLDDVNPAMNKLQPQIDEEEKKFPGKFSQWQTDLVAAGTGVAIRINSKNYIFNVGYHDGTGGPDDVKSGRSYGVGPTGKESDPSDNAYLAELAALYKDEPGHIDDFMRAILLALTDCDVSGWDKLSDAGQIVATDFMAIYTAENDRHIMVKLKPGAHPWEVDLAAATFVSVYVAKTGKMMKNGQLTSGSITEWWAKGTSGSGIGETRRDRIALQQLIGKHEMSSGKGAATIKAVEAIVGKSTNGDVIQTVFEYLVKPNGPKTMRDNVTLVNAFLAYMNSVATDAPDIQ